MHVLLIPSWYAKPGSPMRGAFFRQQAITLQNAGCKVGILTMPARLRSFNGMQEVRRFRSTPPNAIQQLDDEIIPSYRLPWWGWSAGLAPSKRSALINEAFKQYAEREGQPDVVHGHSALYGGYASACIKQQSNVPAVLTEHATWVMRNRLTPGQRSRLRYTLRTCDHLFSSGPALAEAMKKLAPGIEVDPIGMDIDTDHFNLPATPPRAEPFVFSVIAFLMKKKRIDLLLNAFAKAFKGQAVQLNVGGGGKEMQKLVSLANQLGLGDQVNFTDKLDRDGVRDLLHKTHALVSSSDVETFGVTLAEAHACGLPTVATRSGGPEFFVTPANGLLVDTGDASALADAMRDMRGRYDEFAPATIRANCVERFSAPAMAERLIKTYEKLIQAHGAIA